jgi:enoyl-CoA hydratase
MPEQLDIGVEGRLGVIALDRPEAINAISLGMIEGITAQLAAWRDDGRVRAVLFEGRGPKGFCAGGDVRAVRAHVLEGRPEVADAYFAAEYHMDGLIATYPKPVVAITDGIVMGGGIGIAGHASFRITTPVARYAMPEAGIGFVPDVGVNWILAKAPEHRSLLFLLTGLPVSGADVLALGLADCCIEPEKLAEFRAGVVTAGGTGDIEPALVALMQGYSIQAGERELCELADRCAEAFSLATAAEIVAALAEDAEDDPQLAPLAEALATRSPMSLEAIVAGHRAARRLTSVETVLELDLRLASFIARHPDFAEGVRAQLIDKDRKPRWQPGWPDAATREALAAAVAGAPEPALAAQG